MAELGVVVFVGGGLIGKTPFLGITASLRIWTDYYCTMAGQKPEVIEGRKPAPVGREMGLGTVSAGVVAVGIAEGSASV